MLRKDSIFGILLKLSTTSIEKDLLESLFNLIKDFYFVLDIVNNCNFNLKLFNYLYSDLKIYSIEEIAYMSYVNERTVRRFKNKTEKIIETLIRKDDRYQLLNKVFEKHQNM